MGTMITICYVSSTCLCTGHSLPCMNPAAPVSNAHLLVTRSTFGAVATYTCPLGWHFADGGTARTVECANGTWGPGPPTCTSTETFAYEACYLHIKLFLLFYIHTYSCNNQLTRAYGRPYNQE